MNRRALTLAFRMGAHQAVTQPVVVVGQLVILTALLISYGAVLKAVPVADLERLHLTSTQLVWYLVVTETVTMVGVWHFRQLQNDLRSGLADIWMLRPVEFWPLLLAEWAGQELLRLIPVALTAFALGWILTGRCALDAVMIFVLLPTIIVSTFIILCWCMLIGLSSVWLGECRPVFWLYQKLLFVLGALLWPMAFYPDWLRAIAWLTPFPAILATPGSLVLHQPVMSVTLHAIGQCFWLGLYVLLCARIARAARKRLSGWEVA